MKLRESLRVKFGTLGNGMPYYGQYDWGGTTWLSGIGVKCGAIHKRGGLPHLVEHLLARECRKYGGEQTDLIFEKYLGGPEGDINVRIDRATTFFGHGSLYSKADMLAAFDLFANLFKDRLVGAEGLGSEKAAIHQEYWLYGMDSMPDWLDNLLHQTMYDVNPARNRVDCEPEILEKYTLEQVNKFIGRYCGPDNSFVVMLGPRIQEVKEIAGRYFDDWKPESPPRLKLNRSEDFPALRAVKSAERFRAGINQTHLAIGYPTENYLSGDREALQVLARIWAWRLRRILRDANQEFRRGAYRVLASTPCSFMHGMIAVCYASSDRRFALDAETAVVREAARLRADLVSAEELAAVVYNLERGYLTAFRDSADNLAELIVEGVCNGDPELKHLHSFLDRLRRVSRRKLRDAANKYFTANYARVVVSPEESTMTEKEIKIIAP